MPWTYGGAPFAGQLPQNLRDSVRFLIGDTDSNDPQLQDGEVDGVCAQATPSGPGALCDVYQAAMEACVTLVARYARRAAMTVGDLSIQSNTIAQSYRDLRLTIQSASMRHTVPTPYSGGLSLGDMETDQQDDDLNQPYFSRGMDDDPGGDSSDNLAGTGFTQVVPG